MKDHNQHAFYLRFAREHQHAPWRIVLRSLSNDETRHFADVATLHGFFADWLHVDEQLHKDSEETQQSVQHP